MNLTQIQKTKQWNDYSGYIRKTFGERVQKISVNTGMGCPNLDGSLSFDGCTYCNNSSFSPFYCKSDKSIRQQLTEGIDFFSKKYKSQKYLAYFQSYTNTYTSDTNFENMLNEALNVTGVVGLVVATRPDSISETQIKLLDRLAKSHYVSIEFGIESALDKTLKRINRGHNVQATIDAFAACRDKSFHTGAHLIFGLPGESKQDMLSHADFINSVQPSNLKLHQLQVLEGTALAEEFKQISEDFVSFTVDSYIDLVIQFLEKLNPNIVVERFTSESPKEMIISPDWGGLKNFEFVDKLRKEMKTKDSYQGKTF
ncbi:MAG: TIGR01212 family radical SAM protein [Bacteroidales bacterium]|nr:TIGR01212 family radical SAM protein [Bacteroidales bacterium]